MDLLSTQTSQWFVGLKTDQGFKAVRIYNNKADALVYATERKALEPDNHVQVWRETRGSALVFDAPK